MHARRHWSFVNSIHTFDGNIKCNEKRELFVSEFDESGEARKDVLNRI